MRGLQYFAAARLGLGGPTLPPGRGLRPPAHRAAPFRETGHRILMEALERRGNVAEALLVYDRLRVLLRDELGDRAQPTRTGRLRRLLGETTTTTV